MERLYIYPGNNQTDCLFLQITTRPIKTSNPPINPVQFLERIHTHLLSAPTGTPQLSSCNHVSSVNAKIIPNMSSNGNEQVTLPGQMPQLLW